MILLGADCQKKGKHFAITSAVLVVTKAQPPSELYCITPERDTGFQGKNINAGGKSSTILEEGWLCILPF